MFALSALFGPALAYPRTVSLSPLSQFLSFGSHLMF